MEMLVKVGTQQHWNILCFDSVQWELLLQLGVQPPFSSSVHDRATHPSPEQQSQVNNALGVMWNAPFLVSLHFIASCGWKNQSTLEAHCFQAMAEVLLTWARFSFKNHLFLALSYLKITMILCLFLVCIRYVILIPKKRRWDYEIFQWTCISEGIHWDICLYPIPSPQNCAITYV